MSFKRRHSLTAPNIERKRKNKRKRFRHTLTYIESKWKWICKHHYTLSSRLSDKKDRTLINNCKETNSIWIRKPAFLYYSGLIISGDFENIPNLTHWIFSPKIWHLIPDPAHIPKQVWPLTTVKGVFSKSHKQRSLYSTYTSAKKTIAQKVLIKKQIK